MESASRVLVVEDDKAHLELISRAFALAHGPVEVGFARSLAEARASVARSSPELVITDLLLPDGLGTELLRANGERPGFGMIVMTGFGNERVAAEAIKAGALEYVVKSAASLQSLPQVAERALREWRHVVEHRRSEEALSTSRARLDRIVATAMDAIITIDAEQRIVIFNSAAERIFRCTADEAVGRHIERFIPERHRLAHRSHAEELARTGDAARPMGALGEIVALRADGQEFPAEASISWGEVGSGRFFTVILRDVTQRKRAEEERALLEAQLRQAQKMESVGLLAGGIAHDFNNLVGVILGNAELLLDQVPDGPPREMLGDIRIAGQRAAELTRRLLAFGRKQMLELKAVDLPEVVTRFEPMLRRTLPEDIRIDIRAAPEPGSVRADVGQIEQVLLNLSLNARDAMPGGGLLSIEVRNELLDDGYASKHPGVTPGPHVTLAVSDTGTGMDTQTQEHLFEPFFTTKASGKGSGLGLSTVYGIVKQHGGSISVDSEPGRGSTFRIHLPRLSEDAGIAAAPTSSSARPDERSGETILVLDDNEMVRSATCAMLRRLGYRVLAADCPEGCYQLARVHPGPIDLLLTDVVLGSSNGREVYSRLRSERNGLKVLFMSGYAANVLAEHGVLDEGIHFVPKPFSLQILSAKIREVLGS